MEIDIENTQTISITKIFDGKLDNGNGFSVIASWDTDEWSVDSIMFDEPDDNTDDNQELITQEFLEKIA